MEEELPEIWIAVGFVAFLGILVYYKVHQKVTAMLDARSAEIKAKLDEARQLRDEAKAQQEAADIVAQAETDAKVLAKEAHDNLEASLARRAKLAEEKIVQAEATALREVRQAAVDVAAKAARNLITETLNATRSKAVVDQAIKDLHGKLN